ncbi:MAG: tetratricopeptide repeat protein, partial [Nitrososphaerota archaeon]
MSTIQDTEDLGIELSLDKKLKDAIEKLQGAPLILTGDMESGKTLAWKRVQSYFPKAKEYEWIEVPKGQIEEEEARKLRDRAKQNNTILEGSSYQIEYIFSGLPVKYEKGEEEWDKWLGVIKKRKEKGWDKWLWVFKKKEKEAESSSTGPLGTAARVEAKLSYEDATKLYEYYAKKVWGKDSDIESQDKNELKRRMDYFLSLASWGGLPKKEEGGQLCPSLLYEMMKKHKGKREEELKNEVDIGKARERLVAGIFGISTAETLVIATEDVDYFSRLAAPLVPMIPVVGGILLVVPSLLIFHNRRKNEGLDRYVSVHAAWNKLPIQKQKFLCEKLDMKFKLPPWSSFEWLSSWLSKPKESFRSELEKLFTDDNINKIKSVIEEMPEIKKKIEKIQEEIDNYESRIQSLEVGFKAINKELYSQGIVKVTNEGHLQELLNIPADKSSPQTLVGTGDSEADKEVKEIMKDIINSASNKVVVLSGEPGAGKTTLLFLLAREIMNTSGSRLYFIDDVKWFDPVLFQKMDGSYAITELTDQDITETFFEYLLELREVDTLGRVIVSVRTGYIDQEMLQSMRQNDWLKLIEVKLRESVLSEIARRGLQQSMAEQDVERGVSVLLSKAEGLPIYISEALKVIEKKKREQEKRQVSIEELDELPEGIKELVSRILEEEEKINGADIKIAYYLISHTRGLPVEYLKAFKEVYNVEKPRFAVMGQDRKMFLHSWYQDVLDEIAEEERLPFRLDTTLKAYLDDIEKSLDKSNEQQKTFPLKPLIKAVNEFERNIASASLEDMADLMMLGATVHLSIQNLQKEGGREGFHILFERVDMKRLTARGRTFLNRLLGFLVNDYLSGKMLAGAIQIKDTASRPFYTLSVLYMSRLFDDELAKRVDRQFIGEGVVNPISISEMANSFMNAPHPLRMYITALASVLEKIGYFKPEGHYEKGLMHYCKGEFEEAIREYDIAISLDPTDPSYHYNKGNALNALKKYEDAIREYDIAISLDPTDPSYHYNKGNALNALKKYEDAIREYDIAISLDPTDPSYHYNKGNALNALKKYEDAIREYDIAISLDPTDPSYHYNKGNALNALKKYEDAIREYDIA